MRIISPPSPDLLQGEPSPEDRPEPFLTTRTNHHQRTKKLNISFSEYSIAIDMFLDDLFNQALILYKQNADKFGFVMVDALITTNHTPGLTPTGNASKALETIALTYTSGGIARLGKSGIHFYGAYFEGRNAGAPPLIIASPSFFPQHFPSLEGYSISLERSVFVPSVDGSTNIIYGPAGNVFVTISLCNLRWQPGIS